MTEITFDDAAIDEMYRKVVEEPNKHSARDGFVKCPECGEEILLIPALRAMNEAIENHIQTHKKQLKDNAIQECQTAVCIRLNLMMQVLKRYIKR